MTCPDLVKATVATSPSVVETEKQRPFNFLKIRKEKVLGKVLCQKLLLKWLVILLIFMLMQRLVD